MRETGSDWPLAISESGLLYPVIVTMRRVLRIANISTFYIMTSPIFEKQSSRLQSSKTNGFDYQNSSDKTIQRRKDKRYDLKMIKISDNITI